MSGKGAETKYVFSMSQWSREKNREARKEGIAARVRERVLAEVASGKSPAKLGRQMDRQTLGGLATEGGQRDSVPQRSREPEQDGEEVGQCCLLIACVNHVSVKKKYLKKI